MLVPSGRLRPCGIEVAAAKLADLDRRLATIDGIVAGAAQRGRANTAAGAGVQARATIAESEAMPLRYAAELLGMGGDDERAIWLLIVLMVLSCDPLAIALTAAASSRRSTTA